jgi:Transcriptional regulator PadR-like family
MRTKSRPLNFLERAILGSLADEQPAHAFAVVKALRHPDGECMFVESSVYRAIARLAKAEFLEQGEMLTTKGLRDPQPGTDCDVTLDHLRTRRLVGLVVPAFPQPIPRPRTVDLDVE